MRRCVILAALLAGPAAAEEASPIAGLGREPCATVVGTNNAPMLAQAADWALGYLAGRIDAGEVPVDGELLGPENALDVVTSIATRCRQSPEAPIIDAVRAYAARVFGAEAQGGTVEAAPLPPAYDTEGEGEEDAFVEEMIGDSDTSTLRPKPRPETGGGAAD